MAGWLGRGGRNGRGGIVAASGSDGEAAGEADVFGGCWFESEDRLGRGRGGKDELLREEALRLATWWPGFISFTVCQLILKRGFMVCDLSES